MNAVVAVDLGGTRCRFGIAGSDDPAAVILEQDLPAPTGREAFLRAVRDRLEANGAESLGIGIPGLAVGNICRWVPNLPFLDGLDLARELPGVSIGLGNDAQLCLLAEAKSGAARGCRDALLLAIGTGIGSAVLADGRIVPGHHGGACSFGWATADLGGGSDGASGWLEAQASGRALDRLARGLGLADGPALVEAARRDESFAREALQAPVAALAATLGGAVCLLDPAMLVIAGGMAEALDVVGPPLRAALDARLPPHLRGVALQAAHHGAAAGLVGAAFAGSAGAEWRRMS